MCSIEVTECRAFGWTGRREEAARLVAEDRLTNEEIAGRVGVSRQALDKWKRHPVFVARVGELVVEMANAVREHGIASKERRMAALNDRWLRMLRVIDERAREMADLPGGGTGILTRRVRKIRVQVTVEDPRKGTSVVQRAIEGAELVVDVGLLRELREHERQAAVEMGQLSKAEDPMDLWAELAEGVRQEMEDDERVKSEG